VVRNCHFQLPYQSLQHALFVETITTNPCVYNALTASISGKLLLQLHIQAAGHVLRSK